MTSVASELVTFGQTDRDRPCPTVGERAVEIVAHRGASFLAPENTLAAVNLAWELGADAVEVDVHLSADGRIVAIHDPCTDRTAGVRHPIAQTSSSHLRRLNVGRRAGPEPSHARIPFLEEILCTIPAGRRLFVEIKCGPEIVPALSRLLGHESRTGHILVIGFDIETLARCKAAMPETPMYHLHKTRLAMPYRRRLIDQARAHGLDGLNLKWPGLRRNFAEAVKAEGLALYTWTVDEIPNARRLIQMGIEGITTNRPGWLRTHLSGRQHRDPVSADAS